MYDTNALNRHCQVFAHVAISSQRYTSSATQKKRDGFLPSLAPVSTGVHRLSSTERFYFIGVHGRYNLSAFSRRTSQRITPAIEGFAFGNGVANHSTSQRIAMESLRLSKIAYTAIATRAKFMLHQNPELLRIKFSAHTPSLTSTLTGYNFYFIMVVYLSKVQHLHDSCWTYFCQDCKQCNLSEGKRKARIGGRLTEDVTSLLPMVWPPGSNRLRATLVILCKLSSRLGHHYVYYTCKKSANQGKALQTVVNRSNLCNGNMIIGTSGARKDKRHMTKYYYRDFDTKKIRYTRASFAGWTTSTGLLNVRYATFVRRADIMYVPEYLLTKETREALEAKSQKLHAENGGAQ
jgi:hypothetical protein